MKINTSVCTECSTDQ